jgi:hypothetical protein
MANHKNVPFAVT